MVCLYWCYFYAVTLYVPTKFPRNCVRSQKHVNRLYPTEVRKAFAKKLQYWRKYKASPDKYTLKLKYQQCAQNCNRYLNCESRVVDADNIGAFYRFVNVRLGNKTLVLARYMMHLEILFLMIVAKQIC